jgi:phage gp16-like protein
MNALEAAMLRMEMDQRARRGHARAPARAQNDLPMSVMARKLSVIYDNLDGQKLEERAFRVAADDTDWRQKRVLRLLLDALYARG